MKKNPNRLKTLRNILAIYIVLLLMVEGLGQLTIRYLESRQPSGLFAEEILSYQEPVVGFALRKNLNQKMGMWDVRTDELGLRNDIPLASPKPENEIRIFMVGGSTVFGWSMNSQDTIPGRLQKRLDQELNAHYGATNKKIRIINAGVPWYASWHEAASIFFRVMDLKPDWIIVLDGLNDTALSLTPSWTPLVRGFVDTPTRIAYEKRAAHENFWLVRMLDLSPTFRYVHARLKERAQLKAGVVHPKIWDQYLGYAERISQITAAKNIRYSIFFQPVMLIDKPLDPYEVDHNGTSMRESKFAANFREIYLMGERALLAHPTLRIKSLRSAFRKIGETIYLDGLHYNELGNATLAEAIFQQEIAPNLPKMLQRDPTIVAARNRM